MDSNLDTDERELRALAQVYFDAAYNMDAERFRTIFHPLSAITRLGDGGDVAVVPLEVWLEAVSSATAPRDLGLERRDEVLAVDVSGDLALLKLSLQMPSKHFTDLLSCLKVKGAWRIVQKVMRLEVRA